MSEERTKWGTFVLIALVLAAGYFGYKRWFAATPVQKIEKLIDYGAGAAESESIIRLSGVFSSDYTDASGLDRSAVLGQAQQFFQQSSDVQVKIERIIHEDPNLPATADHARAIVVVRVSGKSDPGGQPFEGLGVFGGGAADAFLVDFKKEGRDWEISHTKHLETTSLAALQQELGASKP